MLIMASPAANGRLWKQNNHIQYLALPRDILKIAKVLRIVHPYDSRAHMYRRAFQCHGLTTMHVVARFTNTDQVYRIRV
jgi:hypothetical protein